MIDAPWLTIVGLGEDGPDGLSAASRYSLDAAEVVMGAKRHLTLLPDLKAKIIEWPVPFSEGLPLLRSHRGRRVVVLASGDPFWFGAGSSIANELDPGEWRAVPGVSTFSLAAARLGWPLEQTVCLGLHAAPVGGLRPHLAPGVRAVVLLRNGDAISSLVRFLVVEGFGSTRITILEALGGPRERIAEYKATGLPDREFVLPVAVAIEVAGAGAVVSCASGIPDELFDTDGQITKRPIRALALSALAPRPMERLWDIGSGSGSIALEWLLSHPTAEAISVEARADRTALIRANAARLGLGRLQVVEGEAPAALDGLTPPQAVFIGGGLTDDLMVALTTRLAPGTRVVTHAVTLETEAVLSDWSARLGGALLRIALSEAAPLGPKRGWKGAYPIVQWRVVL